MTAFSKLFAERAKNLTCKDLLHPDHESCLSFLSYFLRTSTVQTLKYLGPIFLIPLVVNFRNVTHDEWIEKTLTYFKMSFGVSITVSCAFAAHCFLYNLHNEVRFYNLSAMPMWLAQITFVNYLPSKFANMQFLLVNNLLVQTILRTTDYQSFQVIRESRILSTMLFMAFSSLIMGLMALTKGENHRYWYAHNFEVTESKKDSDNTMGSEFDILKRLVHKQFLSTVKVGLIMSSAKVILSSFHLLMKRRIFEFIVSIVKNFDYKLLAFFGIYGTSFQVFNFLLRSKAKPHRRSFLAGFLAGSAFYISPRYFLFTYGLTDLIELLNTFYLSKMNEESKMTIFLKKLPWVKIFICISLPIFSHWRVVRPWLIPKLMEEFMRIFAVDRLAMGSQHYAKHILQI